MVLGKTLESSLDHKEIKPVNSEGNQLWTVIGRTKAEVPTLWPRELKGLLAQRLKRLSAMQETWVRSLGREDPLEKEMATHCTILAQRIPWTEEPGRLQSTGSQRVGHDWVTSLHFTSLIGRDQDAEKDWGQEKGAAEDEMVRQNYQLNAHECEQTPGDSEGQASLVCYSPWGHKEWDMTEHLNNKQ